MRRQSGFALFEVLLGGGGPAGGHLGQPCHCEPRERCRRPSRCTVDADGARCRARYLQDYVEALRHADSPGDLLLHGFQNWSAPTLAELKAAGLLDTGFQSTCVR